MSLLGVESAFDVLVRARALEAQGRSIVHLEIGEPDFPTAPHIVEAAKRALDAGHTHYGPPQGLPALRTAIAKHIRETRGFPCGPEHVCVTPGAKPILFFVMLALIEPGDEVVYPNPGFPIYESLIRYLGATGVPLAPGCITDRTRLVILNSPENPTGRVMTEEELAQLTSEIGDRDLVILSDEIYSQLWYDAPPVLPSQIPGLRERMVILDGFSKTYAMTGWRLGYGVLPQWLVDPVNKLMVNSNSCTATFTQYAGIAALEAPQDGVRQMVAEFKARRDAFCSALDAIPGFRCALPGGAFYAWADIRGTGKTSKEIADRLLDECGVACLNGASFGSRGEGYVRFSYANSMANLMEAVGRIRGMRP